MCKNKFTIIWMFLEHHLCMPAGSTNKWKCFKHNCANFIDKMKNKKVKYCSTLLLTTFQRWQNYRDLCGFNKLFPTKAFPDKKRLMGRRYSWLTWGKESSWHTQIGCISLRLIFWLYLVFFKVWNGGERKGRVEKNCQLFKVVITSFSSLHP